MKLSNNRVENLNTNFGVNVIQTHLTGINSPVSAQTIQTVKFPYVSSYVLPQTQKFLNVNSSTKPDSLVTNLYNPKQLLNAYSNSDFVMSMINANPKIKEILNSKNIGVSISPENIKNIINSHLTTTTAYALQIANQMNISPADKKLLEQACVFHDFGKILIPKELINKKGLLALNEKKIVDMHADLGAELLSTTGMNKRVLDLIKNHHMPLSNNNDILGQILSVADIYSALREERSYKNPLSAYDALSLLDQKALTGEVSTEVVNALKSTVNIAQVA